jgi:hypothetical protein
MRNETFKSHEKEGNNQTTPKRSTSQPRQPNAARVSHPSSETTDRKRPISQPRASMAGKVMKQPNSETEHRDKARSVKIRQSKSKKQRGTPSEKTSMGSEKQSNL